MPRPATGSVVIDGRGKSARYALRFTAYGRRQYVTVGSAEQGWTKDKAEVELQNTLADVRRGIWRPPVAEPVEKPPQMPTFLEFASGWWSRAKRQLAEKTQTDYLWRLDHLLPFFHNHTLDVINVDAIDHYMAVKLDQGLSPRSVNLTLILLGAILESAVERDLIEHNRAKGKRVKERKPQRSYLENADQITALLDAAAELDREATRERRHIERRAILATLIYAGVRIGELCSLRWRDVNLATGWLHVSGTKSDTADRRVKIRGALLDELLALRGRHQNASHARFVFPSRTGGELSEDNVRTRVVGGSVKRANKRLAEHGLPPLPAKITPHSLRRTFASVLYALGEDPGVVMDEMGHTDPGLALRVYRQTMRREDNEKAALRRLVDGAEMAANGSKSEQAFSEAVEQGVGQ